MLSLMLNGFALAVIAMLTAATLTKFRDVRQAARWPKTAGRIVKSRTEARTIVSNITPGAPSGPGGRRGSATAGIRNFAAIAFDYTVDGKHHTGTRVSVGDDTGNTSVAETLARYPMGKKVDVFYDPANPGRSVLERSLPEGAFEFMVLLIVFLAVVDIAMNLSIGPVADFVTGLIPVKRFAGMSAFLGLMGIFVLLFAVTLQRQIAATATWRPVEAKIIDPGNHPELAAGLDRPKLWTVYQYEIGGTVYTSDNAGSGEAARGYFGKTFFGLTPPMRPDPRAGQTITIYADPANPARCVRSRGYGGFILLALAASVLFGAAVYLGVFA